MKKTKKTQPIAFLARMAAFFLLFSCQQSAVKVTIPTMQRGPSSFVVPKKVDISKAEEHCIYQGKPSITSREKLLYKQVCLSLLHDSFSKSEMTSFFRRFSLGYVSLKKILRKRMVPYLFAALSESDLHVRHMAAYCFWLMRGSLAKDEYQKLLLHFFMELDPDKYFLQDKTNPQQALRIRMQILSLFMRVIKEQSISLAWKRDFSERLLEKYCSGESGGGANLYISLIQYFFPHQKVQFSMMGERCPT